MIYFIYQMFASGRFSSTIAYMLKNKAQLNCIYISQFIPPSPSCFHHIWWMLNMDLLTSGFLFSCYIQKQSSRMSIFHYSKCYVITHTHIHTHNNGLSGSCPYESSIRFLLMQSVLLWPWQFNFLVTDFLPYSLVTSCFLRSIPSTLNPGIRFLALKLQSSHGRWHNPRTKHVLACLWPLSDIRICVDNMLRLCLNRYPESGPWFRIWNNGTSPVSTRSLSLGSVLYLALHSHICMLVPWISNVLPSSQAVIQIPSLFYSRGQFEVFALTFFHLICSTN